MDATITSPRDKNPALSPLMMAKAKLQVGVTLNACPFGCGDEDIDERGLCRHLAGYTNNTPEEVKKGAGLMEPLVQFGDTRQVCVRREQRKARGPNGREVTLDGPVILEPIPRDAVLVRITVSYRVYINVDKEPKAKG